MPSAAKTCCLLLTSWLVASVLVGEATAQETGGTCVADAQCEVGSICQAGRCVHFEKPTRILLYRRDGASTRLLPFYFSRAGEAGHRIVAPLYWQFWSPGQSSRVLAPFYFHFESPGHELTVVPPYVHSIRGLSESWAIWPLFYTSNRDGWWLPPLLSFRIDEPETGRSRGLYGGLYYWSRDPVDDHAFDLGIPLFASRRSRDSSLTWTLPLNFFWREGETSGLLGFPLLYAKRGPDQSTTVVGNVFHHRKGPTSSSGILPLAFWGKDNQDQSSWGMVLPLAYWRRDPYSLTIATPAGYWYRDPDTRSVAWFVPPIVHHRSPSTELDSALGLFWRVRDRETDLTTTALLPFFFRRTSPEESLTAAGVAPLLAYRGQEADGGQTAGLFPFAFFRWGGQRPYAFVLPFLFHIHDRQRSNTVLFPLFQTSRSPHGSDGSIPLALLFWGSSKDKGYAVQFPFLWHFRHGEDSATLLLPFLYRDQSARSSFLAAGVAPFWIYSRHKDQRHDFGLFPLAYFLREPGSSSSVVLPLFARWGSGQDRTTVLLPLFGRSQTATSDAGTVLPLLFFWSKDSNQTTLVQFPFLCHFADREAGTATTVVPPFFARHRDPEGSFGAAGVAPLIAYWSRDAEGKLRGGGFSPFLFFGSDGERRYTVVAPLYYRSRTADTSSSGIFPLLLFWGRTPESSYQVQVPFFWRIQDGDRTTTVAPPFYYRSRTADTSSGGILPLLLFWGRNSESSYQVQVPFFWRIQDGDQTTTVAPPFYYRSRTADTSSSGVLPLLLFWGRTPDSSYQVQVPLYWRLQDGDQTTTVAPPFLWRQTSPGKSLTIAGIPPVWAYHGRDGDGVKAGVFPLVFVRQGEQSHQVVFPLFWRFADRTSTSTTVVPLFHHSSGTDQASMTLFPLLTFWGRQGESSYAVQFPFYWRFRGDGRESTTVFPLFHYRADAAGGRGLFTLLAGAQAKGDERFWYVGPLLHGQTATQAYTAVIPLGWTASDRAADTHTRFFLPLLHYASHSPAESFATTLLLYWHHADKASSQRLVLPLFYQFERAGVASTTILLPFYARHRNEVDDTTTTLLPLFYRRVDRQDSTTVGFPLYWSFQSPDRGTSMLLPFYVHLRRPAWRATYIFPNVYYRTGQGPAAGTSELHVFPFWEHASRRPGDTFWQALLGLVGYERIGRNRYMKLLFIPFEITPAPAGQADWYGRGSRQTARGLDTNVW